MADITEVMGDIAKMLDVSITGVGMPSKPAPVMDLSKIDFAALRSRFKESKHKNTDLEVLKATIAQWDLSHRRNDFVWIGFMHISLEWIGGRAYCFRRFTVN